MLLVNELRDGETHTISAMVARKIEFGVMAASPVVVIKTFKVIRKRWE